MCYREKPIRATGIQNNDSYSYGNEYFTTKHLENPFRKKKKNNQMKNSSTQVKEIIKYSESVLGLARRVCAALRVDRDTHEYSLLASRGTPCEAGLVRLLGGQGLCEGRVEVYYNRTWRRVLPDSWSSTEASVVCRELGCSSVIPASNSSRYGVSHSGVYLTGIHCSGDETHLGNCSSPQPAPSNSINSAAVLCTDSPNYLDHVSEQVYKYRGQTVPLEKPAGYPMRIGGLDDTIYAEMEDELKAWEDFYLPERVEMRVIGAIDTFPSLAVGLQLIIVAGRDGNVYAYENEVLHQVADSLQDLFEKGIEFPGTKVYNYGECFAPMISGHVKGGKGLGKGGAKRHRKVLHDNNQGITKPAIRRLARRVGVKRISGLIYEEPRGVLKVFLENVIRDAITYTEHAKRKTVTAKDVVYALKRQGRTLYGFGG
ncbi:H4 protein, partial [Polyodon spathula]|nr:H4 protein [Polyodon spathula]